MYLRRLGNLIAGLGGVKKAKEALEVFRKKTTEAGFKGLHLQLILTGGVVHNLSGVDRARPFPGQVAKDLNFDSVTNYHAHLTYINRDYNAVVRDVQISWDHFASLGMLYYGTTIPVSPLFGGRS